MKRSKWEHPYYRIVCLSYAWNKPPASDKHCLSNSDSISILHGMSAMESKRFPIQCFNYTISNESIHGCFINITESNTYIRCEIDYSRAFSTMSVCSAHPYRICLKWKKNIQCWQAVAFCNTAVNNVVPFTICIDTKSMRAICYWKLYCYCNGDGDPFWREHWYWHRGGAANIHKLLECYWLSIHHVRPVAKGMTLMQNEVHRRFV